MDAEGVSRALARKAEKIKAAGSVERSTQLMSRASSIGASVRRLAAAAGDSIVVRIIQRDQKVIQVKVSGRNAARYREMIKASLRTSLPQVSAEVRHQIIDGVK